MAGTATQIAINAGNDQTVPAGTAVPVPPSVIVRDAHGNPVAGVSVTFAVAPGNGTITGASQTTNASGIAAVGSWTLATTAGTDTLTATSADLAGSQVTFTATGTPGGAGSIAVNAGNGQSATVGTAVATDPSVIVRDRFGNPVANVAVTFAVASGNGSVTGANQTTNASGVATVTSWTLGTTVGTNTLRATSQGLNGSPVIFTATGRPAAPSASRSLVSVTPGVITASTGSSVATISVTVRDGFDNPIPGATVMLAATPSAGNTLTQPAGTTDASGEITGTLSSTAAGTKTVTAIVNGTLLITETATVTVTAGAVSASQSTLAATSPISAGAGASTITVTARDAHGNPIEGATVVLAATPTTGNTLTQPVGTTNADGVATGTLASTAAGDKTVSATINNSVAVAQTVTVTVTPGGVSASRSTVVAAPTSIAAGSGSSTITVTARDASGNPIQGVTVTLAASPGAGNTLTQPVGTTNASGVATATLSSTVAGLKTVSAMIGSVAITQTATVTVTAGAAAAITSNSMNPQAATAGTEVGSPPSVIVRDASGNPVAGVAVTFAVEPGNGDVAGANQTTDASGIATVGSWTLSTTAGPNRLTARAAGSGISGNPVTFTATGTAGAATQLVLTTPPSSSAQSGVAFLQQPVVQLQDANGNPVSESETTVTAVVASGPAGATLTNARATTVGSGAATFNGLAITGAVGDYALRFESGSLTPATSGTITLGAGTATQLTITTPPSPTAASGAAFTPQPVIQVRDAAGNPVGGAGVPVTAVIASGPAGATLSNATATTLASGAATFTGLAITGSAGSYTLRFESGPLTPATSSPITLSAGAAATLVKSSGDNLTGQVATRLQTPHVVLVSDATGNPVAGVTVTWAAASGGGSVDPTTATTDANGHAQTVRTLGLVIGTQTTTATATIGGTATTVTFSITATAAGASQMTAAGGDGQTGTVGATLPTPLAVRVADQFNNPVAGVTVTWTPPSGSGAVNPPTSTTDGSGIATTRWTLGTAAGPQTVQATGAGSPVTFSATATAGAAAQLTITTPPSATATSGAPFNQQPVLQVRDGAGNSVGGAGRVVTAVVASGPAGATLSNATATTLASGAATFSGLAISGTAGSYTLRFESGPLTPATSGPITLSAGTATQLTITTEPSATATSGAAFTPQPVLQLRDAAGNPAGGAGLTVTAVIATGPAGATLSNATATTVASGAATFSGLAISGTAGSYTLRFESGPLTPATSSPITLSAGAAATLVKSSGDNLTGQVATRLQTPHVVLVSDATGNPVAGVTVTWAAASGGGSVDPTTATTDANGHAQTVRTLGLVIGTQTTTATATIGGTATTVTFSITATAAGASQMTAAGGDGQTGTVGATLPTPLAVRVADQFNNPVAGVTVTWTPPSGSGAVNPPTSTTDGSGIATTRWTLGTAAGPQTVQATGAGSPVTFSATATAGAAAQLTITTPPSATATSGAPFNQQPVLQVRDGAGNSVGGAGRVVTAVVASGPAGATLSNATATTLASGAATFSGLAISGAAGSYTLRFESGPLTPATSSPITLSAGAAATLVKSSGDNLTGQVATRLQTPHVVLVSDATGNPVAGVTVTWAAA